jgi:hypothetical protein
MSYLRVKWNGAFPEESMLFTARWIANVGRFVRSNFPAEGWSMPVLEALSLAQSVPVKHLNQTLPSPRRRGHITGPSECVRNYL